MGFADIDLSKLPAPDLVEELDAEKNYARLKADLVARFPSLTPRLDRESDPLVKALQTVAYEGMLFRNRINEAARAVLLSEATGADLDALAALVPLERKILVEEDLTANPVVTEVKESDDDFRRRIRLAPQGFSTAGPRGAYVFHALSAHGQVKDAESISPTPNNITVGVLSNQGDGTPSQEVIDAVEAALAPESVRPQGDVVSVQPASILTYSVTATIEVGDGPDPELVRQAVQSAVTEYVESQHKIGGNVLLKHLNRALLQEGVDDYTLASPLTDQMGEADPQDPSDLGQAPYADQITITLAT